MVYIDTEGSFLLQRVVDIATAGVRHCSLFAEDDEQRVAMETFTVETILSNMFLVMITGFHGYSPVTGITEILIGCLSLRCVAMTMWSSWLNSTCSLASCLPTQGSASW